MKIQFESLDDKRRISKLTASETVYDRFLDRFPIDFMGRLASNH